MASERPERHTAGASPTPLPTVPARPEIDSQKSPVKPETVVVLDFGSQFSMLIARRIRECSVFCEIVPPDAPWDFVSRLEPRGIVLSGGPASVYEPGAPTVPPWVYESGLPVLGICYGMQALAHDLGGEVRPSPAREYGHAVIHRAESDSALLRGLPDDMPVWMSHGDKVLKPPPGFRILAGSDNSPIAAIANDAGIVAIQFHPEVVHTPGGKQIIENFLVNFCGCHQTWTAGNFIDESIEAIRRSVGDEDVICALSGGVDSAVAAALVHRAVGEQLICVFVDNGLLRQGEADQVVETFERHMRIKLIHVDARERFMRALAEVTNPETKRLRIGETFIRVFEAEAHKLGGAKHIVQGTTYPDVIESAPSGNAAKIKSHHNVGGLPADMALSLVEPLRFLFKDEVRLVGKELGLPDEIVHRQPFPGPGLAIRIIGEVTWDKLETLRGADRIVLDEIRGAGLERDLWQSFAILTDTRSVGVMGDFRTYGHVVALRAVEAEDAMTADWARLPYDVLAKISSRIVNEVPGVNRVVYDITSKPPGTIEWE
jgi:GMP synthase (glutamine-hydrolysing)